MEYYTGTVLANIGYGLDGKIKWSTVKKPIPELGGEAWAQAISHLDDGMGPEKN